VVGRVTSDDAACSLRRDNVIARQQACCSWQLEACDGCAAHSMLTLTQQLCVLAVWLNDQYVNNSHAAAAAAAVLQKQECPMGDSCPHAHNVSSASSHYAPGRQGTCCAARTSTRSVVLSVQPQGGGGFGMQAFGLATQLHFVHNMHRRTIASLPAYQQNVLDAAAVLQPSMPLH
jgi:hypothetical protein